MLRFSTLWKINFHGVEKFGGVKKRAYKGAERG